MNRYPTICGKCDGGLRESSFNSDRATSCPQCYTPVRAYVFPAWKKELETVEVGQSVLDVGEASCFNHETRKAASICDDCGKFLCSLCSISYAGKRICTSCVSREKAGSVSLKLKGRRPDLQALWLSLVAVVMPILGLFISGFALYLVVKHWNSDDSYVKHSKWRFVVAGILSGVVFFGSLFLIALAIFE